MAYESTGMQALLPVYFSRMAEKDGAREDYDVRAAQNESSLNQNLETLYRKLLEIEEYLASST
ncbi:MAG TPA: hypothetical protein P5075_11505 [Eubacteriales bacterium]|nr:hypothetical protein [Eubacteriales bacterium]